MVNGVKVMVFNATFNHFSVITWREILYFDPDLKSATDITHLFKVRRLRGQFIIYLFRLSSRISLVVRILLMVIP